MSFGGVVVGMAVALVAGAIGSEAGAVALVAAIVLVATLVALRRARPVPWTAGLLLSLGGTWVVVAGRAGASSEYQQLPRPIELGTAVAALGIAIAVISIALAPDADGVPPTAAWRIERLSRWAEGFAFGSLFTFASPVTGSGPWENGRVILSLVLAGAGIVLLAVKARRLMARAGAARQFVAADAALVVAWLAVGTLARVLAGILLIVTVAYLVWEWRWFEREVAAEAS